MSCWRSGLLGSLLITAHAWTPFSPTAQWTYYFEASRGVWPSCPNRFIAGDADNTKAGLSGAGTSAELTVVDTGSIDATVYLQLASGRYLSYAGTEDCSNVIVDTWPEAGINQQFRLTPVTGGAYSFEWTLHAAGRNCPNASTVTFATDCDNNALAMGNGSSPAVFHMHPLRNNGDKYDKIASTPADCADPFAWYSEGTKSYYLACTGDKLPLYQSTSLRADTVFTLEGSCLGGTMPTWGEGGDARWAPENLEVETNKLQVLFYSDSTGSDQKHRVGWSMSEKSGGPLSDSWTLHSTGPLNLGNDPAGEIDQHIFRDIDDRTYLLWKTDDNSVGSKTTRIWGQEILIAPGNVTLIGAKRELMDSSGLFWVESFIEGGSLIEGPEIIHRGEYYYLFFAAGRFCQTSYSEGVARSKSIWGPYEKAPVPLLSTGAVGYSDGHKQVGPGHASYVSTTDGKFFAVYHASKGECNMHTGRVAFIEEMQFDSDSAWPYIDFEDHSIRTSSAVMYA